MERHPAELPSRGERQQQTRAALVVAARDVFARSGYHGAGLDEIARVAGYSKGAVYSNFAGKAELFLAVMDANLDYLTGETWDPFDPAEPAPAPAAVVADAAVNVDPDANAEDEVSQVIRGIALATLEFIAVAARDEQLSAALASRVRVQLDLYTRIAEQVRADDEPLAAAEVGALLTALDQGVALLALSGLATIDQRMLRIGLRRLVDPLRAATHDTTDVSGGPAALHDQVVQQRIAAARRNPG